MLNVFLTSMKWVSSMVHHRPLQQMTEKQMSSFENAGFTAQTPNYICPECKGVVFDWQTHIAWHVKNEGNWAHGDVTLCKHCFEEIDGDIHAGYNEEYCNDDTGNAADPIGSTCTAPCVGYDAAYGLV